MPADVDLESHEAFPSDPNDGMLLDPKSGMIETVPDTLAQSPVAVHCFLAELLCDLISAFKEKKQAIEKLLGQTGIFVTSLPLSIARKLLIIVHGSNDVASSPIDLTNDHDANHKDKGPPMWTLAHDVVKSAGLTVKDRDALRQMEYLNDKHLFAASLILRTKFISTVGFASFPDTAAWFTFNHYSPTELPRNAVKSKDHIHIAFHHVNTNHWVVSWCQGGEVFIYDSIFDYKNESQIPFLLRKHLCMYYKPFISEGRLVVRQVALNLKQDGGTDCGLFVIAVAYHICSRHHWQDIPQFDQSGEGTE